MTQGIMQQNRLSIYGIFHTKNQSSRMSGKMNTVSAFQKHNLAPMYKKIRMKGKLVVNLNVWL